MSCRRAETLKWHDLDGTSREIRCSAICLKHEVASRQNVIFENAGVAEVGADNDALRRIRQTARTEEAHFSAQLIVCIVDENNSCPPTNAICEMRNNNALIHIRDRVSDWNRAEDRIVSFIGEEPQRRHKHR